MLRIRLGYGLLSELGMSKDKNQSENETSYTTDNNPVSIPDEHYDDFMCLMRTDGSTIASSGGVTVIGRKVPKTLDELYVNNPWYKRVWAYLNKPITSK
jgi:hypothetical protein